MDYYQVATYIEELERHLKEMGSFFKPEEMTSCVERGECPFRCKFCLKRKKPSCKENCPKYLTHPPSLGLELREDWKASMDFYVKAYPDIKEVTLEIIKEV